MNEPDQQLVVRKELALKEKRRVESSLVRLSHLAKLMDDQFELPLVKQRVGLDPIIGLIPGGGDWIGWAVSTYVLWEAIRLKVPLKVMFGIARNITMDFLLGYVPVAGDFVDVLFKANKRSVGLLLKHFDADFPTETRDRVIVPDSALEKPTSSWMIRYPLGIAMILFFGAMSLVPITLTYLFFQWWFANP